MKLIKRILLGLVATLLIAIAALAITIGYESPCPETGPAATAADSVSATVYRCYGGPERISVEPIAKPAPANDEVLVRVRSAAVNPLDWHYMRGSPYIMRLESGIGAPEDIRLGVDFAGVVESIGKDVSRFQVGDAVFGGASGAFGDYVTVRENRAIALKPDNMSFAEAAAMPIAAITALQALRDMGELEAGQHVLINGASGGVGTYAVQIAKSMGAEVTAVCSERNADMVRGLGADHVINYKVEDYTDGPDPYDLIIDMIGNHSLSKNRDVLTQSGRHVLVGGPKGDWIGPIAGPLKAMFVAPFVEQEHVMLMAQLDQSDLEDLASMARSGAVRSVIDREYALSEIADAIRYSESGRARGKIIVNVSAPASRQIALSFDDAPKNDGPVLSGDERASKLIAALEDAQAGPAVFFVTPRDFERSGGRERIARYAAAGHLIANHTNSHQWLKDTDTAVYIEDINRADSLIRDFENFRPWFRFPFLDEGTPLKKRDAVRAALSELGLKNGYVTVDNYDWYLDAKWKEALDRGDSVDVEALRGVYVDMLVGAVEFYDAVAVTALGESPAHVLLLHENDVAAEFIGDLIKALRGRGWSIVSPDEAYADPVANIEPQTLKTRQGHIAALAIEAGFDARNLTHLAIEEAEIDALLETRGVFNAP